MARFTFPVITLVFLSFSISCDAKKNTNTKNKSLGYFAQTLLDSLTRNDFNYAMKIIPTENELKLLGYNLKKSEYTRFLEKRKRGFKRVHRKFLKKINKLKSIGIVCKKVEIIEIKKKGEKTRNGIKYYTSLDLFAYCDGKKETKFWFADPDGIFPGNNGWKLLEFN
ncbi:MAG: hypothetical protein JXR95_06355 [Deltaproteobacteria bacterium]|nr:hypothetical protein [Deltaproteobacteria bacterium]